MKSVNVHFGMARAGSTTLQGQFLSQAPGIAYLGKNSPDERLFWAGRELTRQHRDRLDLEKVKAVFDDHLEKTEGVPVFSDEVLSTWRHFHPRELGRRVGEAFPFPRLIFVVRRPHEWMVSRYYFRLFTFRSDTFAGPNPWLEKHLSQLKVGSDLAEIAFTHTFDAFFKAADAVDHLVLPFEMLAQQPAEFLARLETYVGAPGALTGLPNASAPEITKTRLTKAQANFIRTLSLHAREREAFMERARVFADHVRRDIRAEFDAVAANDDASLEDWIAWFKRAQRGVFLALERGEPALTEAVDLFDDYEIRQGLIGHALDVEAEETEAMKARYGVDLASWGYGSAPAPSET